MIESEITYDWKRIIETCYSSDPDLLEKYHILAPTDVSSAMSHTLKSFSQAVDKSASFQIFECKWKGEFMGYYGLEVIIAANVGKIQVLTGFFIMPEFRTNEVKEAFLNHVRSKFPNNKLITYIFSKNKRARGFFGRNGGEVIDTINNLIDGIGEVEYKLIMC